MFWGRGRGMAFTVHEALAGAAAMAGGLVLPGRRAADRRLSAAGRACEFDHPLTFPVTFRALTVTLPLPRSRRGGANRLGNTFPP